MIEDRRRKCPEGNHTVLGIELGSTRIKAVTINEAHTPVSSGELFPRLYEKSLEGDPDCGGLLVCNYLAGQGGPYGMALLSVERTAVEMI